MEKSLKLRKAKAQTRAKDRKLFRKGRLRKGDVCLAAHLDPQWLKGPLIIEKVRFPEFEPEDA